MQIQTKKKRKIRKKNKNYQKLVKLCATIRLVLNTNMRIIEKNPYKPKKIK